MQRYVNFNEHCPLMEFMPAINLDYYGLHVPHICTATSWNWTVTKQI